MDADLALAIGHHLAVFTLVGAIAAEFVLLRPGLNGVQLQRLARLDAVYGGAAMLVVLVGVMRLYWGAAGPDYYFSNHAFWGKMAAFVAVGLLSIAPTIAFGRWRKALRADPGFRPSEGEIRRQRRFLHAELGFLILVPIFAAMMARGYGS
ncbi:MULTISPECIES: DUF2214 family protein [unclassified Devosia]|uniref:DUF2214 family protein n=1 Tax=unclassified Devosia TaxID=196773 RepID=UPI001556899F|nr:MULTISPECIES: DUF2214 family protein [unclassified Devosia]